MKETKKLTISAMAIALGVAFMTLGAFVEVLDLTVAAITSCIMAFIFIEVGKPYTYFVWLGTSILTFVFFPHSFTWVTYLLVFGIYPILKAYIERTKRVFWIPLKLLFFNVSAPLMIIASEYLLGIPFFGEDVVFPIFEENTLAFKIGIYLGLIVALMLYDLFMTFMIRAYFSSIRKRIERILK